MILTPSISYLSCPSRLVAVQNSHEAIDGADKSLFEGLQACFCENETKKSWSRRLRIRTNNSGTNMGFSVNLESPSRYCMYGFSWMAQTGRVYGIVSSISYRPYEF